MQHHDPIKKRVFRLIRENKTTPEEMAQVNMALGVDFADAVIRMLKNHNLTLDDVDVVSTHGQTIWLLSMPRGEQMKSLL
jgi:1,6-anhydro-N-acetylmuramate kinase